MLRTSLSDSQRADLHALRRTALPPVARDRLEMVLLSAAGWSPPRSAAHLGRYPQTVRTAPRACRRRGTPAPYPGRPGPEPDHARRGRALGLLRGLLGQGRPWAP